MEADIGIEVVDTVALTDVVATHEPFVLTPTGAVATRDATFDEWLAAAEWVKQVERASGFWVGDLQLYGERFGEEASQLLDATDLADKTLANAKWVASKIPASRRREVLSFGHHAEVAGLENEAEQDEWLTAAQVDGLSVHELRHKIRVAKAQAAGQQIDYWVTVRCTSTEDQTELGERMKAEGRSVKLHASKPI